MLNGVKEVETNFKNVENNINDVKLGKRFRYWFLELETIVQLENVFVFDLETYNDQEFASGRLIRCELFTRLVG